MSFPSHSLSVARLLLLVVCGLLLLSACSDKIRLSPLAADATILAFGDSLTHGTGANQDQSYPTVLAELSGRTVINAGVPGETTAEGLARLPRVLEESNPDLVILCLGGNDFLRRVDPAQTRANLVRMIDMIRAANVPLVLVAVPQLGLLSGSNPVYKELAREFKLPIENEIVADVLHDRDLKSDPIHPNADGYRRMAEALVDLLKNSGAI
ncbi:MAG: arylesterase [Nevskiales bacterium]